MIILRGLKQKPALKGCVVTIGNFDGVHLGHQALLSHLKQEAIKRSLPMVVVLFEPQPHEFFAQQADNTCVKRMPRLFSLKEKLMKLRQCAVDAVLCLRFNHDLAMMPPQQFVDQLLTYLNVRYILTGSDFRFGYQRQGDLNVLSTQAKACGCIVQTFPNHVVANERVSSTDIRVALGCGNLVKAQVYLGKPYQISGKVVQGAGLGRQWGVPTANVLIKHHALPVHGVYIVKVMRKNVATVLYGVANAGLKPSVKGNRWSLEVHLFDVSLPTTFYGELIEVIFIEKIRNEMKFISLEGLFNQIKQDIKQAKQYCAENIYAT